MKYELSKKLAYKVSSDKEYKEFLAFIESKGFPIVNNLLYTDTWEHIQWLTDDFRLDSTYSIKHPIVNCKDVIGFKDDMFTLPEKWCVKVTEESQETLNNWIKSKSDFDKDYYPVKNWVVNHKNDGSYQNWKQGDKAPLDYTEITFDQFKQYVLKDNVQTVKNEFKKGDYIVQLHDSTTGFKKHFCYKQRESGYSGYLLPELDTSGNPDNGWSAIDFKNSERWRYATEAEIAEYNRLGKPFDVTTLNTEPKSLVGRYLKAKVDYPWGIGNCKKGDYLVIVNSTQCHKVEDTGKNKWIYANANTNYLPHQDFELMPEGFKQFMKNFGKSEDWIPKYKVGDSFRSCYEIITITEVGKSAKKAYRFGNNKDFDTADYVDTLKFLPKLTETSKTDIMTEDKFDSLFRESEEEFKVGDWVIVLEGVSSDSLRFNGQCKKITKVCDRYIEIQEGNSGLWKKNNKFRKEQEFRKATPEEITKATGKSVIPESYLQYPIKPSEAYKEPIAPVDVLNKYQQTPVIYSGKKVKSKIVTIFN